MNLSSPGKTCAATLSEMLVAVGIIGLIAALTLPVVNRLRVAAKATMNLSNHRQIASALIAYAAEHQGVLPYSQANQEVSASGTKETYPRTLCLGGYVSDPAIFFSPLAAPWYLNTRAFQNPKSNSISPWFYTHYAANRYGAMPYQEKNYHPANLRRVAADGNLSRLMLLRDNYRADYDTPGQPYGGGLIWFSSGKDTPPPDKSYHGLVHTAFADGHVEVYRREEIIPLLDDLPYKEPPLFNRLYTLP
ncbi:MAG TPA: type II secretion system protein [Chthoniobacteraceae bacterium]|nr:type II secretion system protein [Chthoniobacteraceae bacterium]